MRLKCYILTAFLLVTMISFLGCSQKDTTDTKTEDNKPASNQETKEEMKEKAEELVAAEEEAAQPEVNEIAFSKTKYFYKDSFELEIISNKPSEIYYSVDGTDPGKKQNPYTKPITISAGDPVKATSVRAIAYYEDGTESAEITHTFIVGNQVTSRFDTLIFSVTTDPYNLFDYEYGIFVEGKLRDDFIAANPGVKVDPDDSANFNMRGKESEREIYLEILKPDGSLAVSQSAGLRAYGGWSRARTQKSFKLFARKEYDENNNKFNYDFFPFKTSMDGKGNILDTFKQLVLRNCGNDNGFGFIRDELFETLAGQAGYPDYEAVRPAAVFINGDYRGFFWLHEVYCDEYFEDHYGKYDGSFDILEGGELFKNKDAEGDNTDVISEYEEMYYDYSNKDLTNDDNYNSLCKVFDVKNYLEYYALNVYIGNEDWPHNNYKLYRYTPSEDEAYGEAPFDGKWRFLLHDLDFSFGIYGTPATTDFLSKYTGSNGEIRDVCPLFGQLMKREDCREIFVKKTLDLINGAFSQKNLNSVLDEMNAARLNELTNTYGRGLIDDWVRPEDLNGRMEDIKKYGYARSIYTLDSYLNFFKLGSLYTLKLEPAEGCRIKINSYTTDQKFEGRYYTAYDTTLTAVLPEGKSVDYWLVNGNKILGDELVITSSMVKRAKVEVSLVIK